MRAFFSAACVLSLIYIISAFGIAVTVEEYNDMWLDEYLYSSYDYSYDDTYDYSYDYGYDDSYYYEEMADSATRMGGFISLAYMLISAAAFLLALLKIKTKTMKVISIIGLSLAGLFLLWSFMPISSPGAAGFDEVGGAFGLAGIALLGLHVVGMIHAFKTST